MLLTLHEILNTNICSFLGDHTDCTFLPPMYQNVLMNETFLKLLDLVCRMHPELDVIYDEIKGCITKIPKQHPDPMKVIQVSY